MKSLSKEIIEKSLGVEDLTQKQGHAINLLVKKLQEALEEKYQIKADIQRGSPIVSKEDNYDALGYPKDEVTLSQRYTRYISSDLILRTQMTSVIPSLLKSYSQQLQDNKLWLCPGIVYRRDIVDKTHVGEPHQMDVWYIKKGTTSRKDLLELIEVIVGTVGKILKTKLNYRCNETSHHYTEEGLEVEIYYQGKWLEILECGLAGKKLLTSCGIDTSIYGGLALGMGLDRLVMIAKGIEDIRILRDKDERVQKQMLSLEKYKSVSKQPMITRDLSLAIEKDVILEEVCEQIQSILGDKSSLVEEVLLVSKTDYELLPSVARERLRIQPGQDNWLLRVILRHPSKSIESKDANEVYKILYEQLHQGNGGYLMK